MGKSIVRKVEWGKEYDKYLKFSNASYELGLFDDSVFEDFKSNTVKYIFEGLNCKRFVLEDYKKEGLKFHRNISVEESLLEWIYDYWSSEEVIEDMYIKSDEQTGEQIIEVFKKSLYIHFESNVDFTKYSEFCKEIRF